MVTINLPAFHFKEISGQDRGQCHCSGPWQVCHIIFLGTLKQIYNTHFTTCTVIFLTLLVENYKHFWIKISSDALLSFTLLLYENVNIAVDILKNLNIFWTLERRVTGWVTSITSKYLKEGLRYFHLIGTKSKILKCT